MATNSAWSVIFEDKRIVKQQGDGAGIGYVINDDDFESIKIFKYLGNPIWNYRP